MKWKDSNLVPIHQCESKTLVSNYHGISLLDVYLKFWKGKFITKSLVLFSSHLTHWQHGFLPGKSTVFQLSQVVHQFTQAFDIRQQVDVIYLEFSKAFARVSHVKLLFQLECLGINGSLLAWFRSYLSGRRQSCDR